MRVRKFEKIQSALQSVLLPQLLRLGLAALRRDLKLVALFILMEFNHVPAQLHHGP